jgi:uncharacterized protein (UPF0333 family)
MVGLLRKKGQAALEFLTTYGWAFMVILVMIGALAYFGVLNPQNIVPDQCSVTSGFSCDNYIVDVTTGVIRVQLINNMAEQLTISNFNVTKSGNDMCIVVTDPTGAILDGSSFEVSCTTSAALIEKNTGGKVKLGFTFDYATDPAYPHLASGTVTATVR